MDDMYDIADKILKADCIILASPIYIWYCTAPMKAMLDRLYGLHKYYGKQTGSSMLEGKLCGLIVTCGYDLEYGISPYEEGIRRFCAHFKMKYIGKAAVQKEAGDDVERFETEASKKVAIDFAHEVINFVSESTNEELKNILKEAGIEFDDIELDSVNGGMSSHVGAINISIGKAICPICKHRMSRKEYKGYNIYGCTTPGCYYNCF